MSKPTPHKAPNWLTWLIPNWFADLKNNPSLIKNDLLAGTMMGVLVIPQSLGYATLAGLPPIMGLYAAIIPTLVYAYVGASSVQALGPVAITAIMTSGALAHIADSSQYVEMATVLALMIGAILMLANWLKLGWIVQFISRGVSSGFISAAAVLIVFSQLKDLIGLPFGGNSLSALWTGFWATSATQYVHPMTATIGIISLILLLINRYRTPMLWGFLPKHHQAAASRLFVMLLVVVGIVASHYFSLPTQIKTLQQMPSTLALPTHFALPSLSTVGQLLPSALLLSFIIFVSTATISQARAKSYNQPYSPSRELTGLSLANIASGLFGGFAVAGGISRTSLNISLGAKSPFASVVCALVILLILLFFSKMLIGLPYAILSAVIVSSAFAMIDFDTLKTAKAQDKAEMVNFLVAFVATCLFGLNVGLTAGLLVSFAGLIYKSHQVHIATLGQVGDSEHFRNINRHSVRTFENLLILRIDEHLYFGNSQSVHKKLSQAISASTAHHVILVMSGVNHLDLTAQEMLCTLNQELTAQQKTLHFAEIKGPVMDKLLNTPLLKCLTGQVFLSTSQAVEALRA